MDKKEYLKEYYIKNKDKLKKQSYAKLKEHTELIIRDKIVENLNNGLYKRIPLSKIKKYDIKKVDDKYI